MHGIPMTEEAFEHLIGLESPYRYELIDGLVYDMTGSSPEHADIADNISTLFKDQLGRQGPCRVYFFSPFYICRISIDHAPSYTILHITREIKREMSCLIVKSLKLQL
jgi:Uma2 family endonuclease